jgi:four helix bundle protein
MKYKRFEELPVWNDAIEMALAVFRWSATGALNTLGDLESQIERATISISNNIAEGFDRGTNNELLNFLYIARGSCAEVRSMLHLLERLPQLEELHREIADLLGRGESISRQLGGWIESLKDSGFQGARSQTSQTRERTQAMKRRDECLAKLQAIQDEAARMDRSSRNGIAKPG